MSSQQVVKRLLPGMKFVPEQGRCFYRWFCTLKHRVGLFNVQVRVGDNIYPANVLLVDGINEVMDKYFLVPKPTVQEKGEFNDHPSVKPIALCEHLIRLATVEGAIILDPFIGSGTTAIAAQNTGRHFIGIDINPDYIAIAQRRLREWRPNLFEQAGISVS